GFWPADVPLVSAEHRAEYEAKRAEWEARTADLRRQMAEIEKPLRQKAMAKERQRFPAEYTRLIDIPADQRTPLEKQRARLVEVQVYNRNSKINPAQMKAADRERWEGMAKRMAEAEKEKPPEPPTTMAMTDIGPQCPPARLLKRGS